MLWMLVLYVNFRLNNPCTLLPQELIFFIRRSKWKMYMQSNRHNLVANFLTVLARIYVDDKDLSFKNVDWTWV